MEEDNKIFIQVIDFPSLLGFCKQVNAVGTLTTFQMPKKATEYTSDLPALTDALIMISKEETWRVKKEQMTTIKIDVDVIQIGTKRLFGVEKVYAITNLNSFFVVPDEKSITEGGFNPAEVIQMSNLVAIRPLVLELSRHVVDEEKGIWGLDVVLKGE